METKTAEWQQKHDAEVTAAWKELLKQPWGRLLLCEVLEEFCHVDASPYHRAKETGESMDYIIGMQDVGKMLRLRAQREDPELYWRMMAEAMNVRRQKLIAQRADAATEK